MSRVFVVILISASVLLAQRVPTVINTGPPRVPSVVSPGPTMQAPPNGVRYGNILFPGGIGPQHTFPGRLSSTVSGFPPYTGVGPGRRGSHFPQGNRTVVVPYAVPVYAGDPYAFGAYPQESPNITVVVPQQPAPSVIINHNYTPETAKPALREYSSSDLPETGGVRVYEGPKKQPEAGRPEQQARTVDPDKPTIYLIALKDSNIRQAIGYWVEDSALHYVTPQSTIAQVPLDSVDKELSHRLNTERGLELDLNATRVRRR